MLRKEEERKMVIGDQSAKRLSKYYRFEGRRTGIIITTYLVLFRFYHGCDLM